MTTRMPTLYTTQGQERRNSNEMLASVCIEIPLCNWISQFDGTKKGFDDIQPAFDALFSDKLIHMMDGQQPIDKQKFICVIKHLLEQQIVATLEDMYFIDDTHVEYTINYSNGKNTSMVIHVEAVVGSEGKIIKIEPCQETKGVYTNMCLDCQAIGGEQHERNRRLNQISMKVRGWGKGMTNQLVTGWGKGMLTPV